MREKSVQNFRTFAVKYNFAAFFACFISRASSYLPAAH